jgi:hypothetical protein
MVGGVQLSSLLIAGGGMATTAGMFVTDNATGQLMILGTFHGEVVPGTTIYQPSNTAQSDGTNGQIGYLVRGGHYLTSPVDADVFSFDVKRGFKFIIEQLCCVKGVRTVGMRDLGMAVTKRGCTSGVTHGTLDGMSYSATYGFITYDNMLTFADDPPADAPFTMKGDSGSVILDSNNNAVALATLGWPYPVTGPASMGPAFPAILAALKVTPCFCGTILPRKVTLTSSESPTPPPIGGRHLGSGSTGSGAWGQSVSGTQFIKSPSGLIEEIRWRVTNVYQLLEFRATAVGFDQPVFRWWINGKQLNPFNEDAFGEVTVSAVVTTDVQLAPANPVVTEPVTLSIGAFHAASYDINGNGPYSNLVISPTEVQGHISLTVKVEVCDLSSAASNPVPPADITPQSASATLDTQVLILDQIPFFG